MKNKKIKNILLLTLFSVLTFSGQEVSGKEIKGKFDASGGQAAIGESGLTSTTLMTFTDEAGNTREAYCAWTEKPTPSSGEYTLKEIENISLKHAIGIAEIINNTSITAPINKSGFSDLKYGEISDISKKKYIKTIKTVALNLYLTNLGVTAGQVDSKGNPTSNRFDNSNQDVVKKWGPFNYYKNDFNGILDYFKDCANNKEYGDTEKGKQLCRDRGIYYKMVYDLYQVGYNASEKNYKTPKLSFTNEDDEFELSGDYYTKTYKVSSNVTLNDLSATVTGVDSKYVTITPNKNKMTIKVSIKASAISEDIEKVKVVAKATTTIKKANVFATADGRKDQDIIVADLGMENVVISTEDIIDNLYRKCYRTVITCDTTKCVNTNKPNSRTCTSKIEEYEAPSCDSQDTLNKPSGKYTAELIAGKCSLYCTEEASVSYPGNVSPAITLGTNFAWPTSLNDRYPLTTSATLTCKIEMNPSATPADRTACVNAAKKGNYKYENSKSGNVIYDNMAEEITIPLEQKCSSSQTVNDTSVTISNNCYYTLPEGKNVAIDKKTVDFIDKTSVDFSKIYTNYILIKYHDGVLPIEGINWNNKIDFKKKYTLKITELALGNKGQFTNVLNNNDYVCNYKVTTVVPGSCQCPPGTKYSGVDISGNIITNKAKNCADAIEKFCKPDDGPPGDTPIYCKKQDGTYVDITSCINDKTKTQKKCEEEAGCIRKCPSGTNNEGYLFDEDPRYQACIKDGGDDNACMLLVCNDICVTNCEYKCPEDSDYPGKDITTCVYNKMGQGMKLAQVKLAQAIAACEKEECYKGTGGGNIIYRTISLENPFPSKDADDNGTTQAGLEALNNRGLDLNKNTFNQTIKGRYPGTNWNSAVLVYNKILNNRGYRGSAIYQEAEPLYVIELDPKAIKEIREYNKKQVSQSDGYADFKLNCTDGAYCISSFLHNNSIKTSAGKEILTGGTCKNAYNKKTFISCYKTK